MQQLRTIKRAARYLETMIQECGDKSKARKATGACYATVSVWRRGCPIFRELDEVAAVPGWMTRRQVARHVLARATAAAANGDMQAGAFTAVLGVRFRALGWLDVEGGDHE